MESNQSTQLKVGIFLAAGIVFTLGSIFFLGADKALLKSHVRIHAHFDQVQGLASGSVVSLSGVTVGNVETITFLQEQNTLDVKMRISEDFVDRIRQGAMVEIRTQGALGDKYIYIIPGQPQAPIIKEGDVLPVAQPTDIIGVLAERGSEASKIFDVINELHKMTAAFNADNRLARILTHLDSASVNLSQVSKETNKLVSQLNTQQTGDKFTKSLDKLEHILTKIDKGEGSLGAFINDPSIHNQLKSILGTSSRKNHVKSLLRTSIEKEASE